MNVPPSFSSTSSPMYGMLCNTVSSSTSTHNHTHHQPHTVTPVIGLTLSHPPSASHCHTCHRSHTVTPVISLTQSHPPSASHCHLGITIIAWSFAPPYMSDDCQLVTDVGRRHLRSSDVYTCVIPRTQSQIGYRSVQEFLCSWTAAMKQPTDIGGEALCSNIIDD